MKKEHIILFVIFIVVLQFRLLFAFQTPYLSTDSAYYNLRQTEYIQSGFKPMIYDELSYGGRYVLDSHLFHYFLAGLGTLLPGSFVYKIVPELLFALMVFIVYGLAKKLTESTTAALFSVFISGFVPIFISDSLNNLSIYSLLMPLMFYQAYCLLNLESHMGRFMVLSFTLPLIHPFSFILSVSFILYVVLLNIESVKPKKLETEAIMLYIFVSMLVSFIIYKKAFLHSGLLAVWQNIPSALLASYFQNINVLLMIYNIGVIPLILGIIGILVGLFREKSKPVYMLSAIILADFTLLFFKLISFQTGMVFLGILMAITSAVAIDKFIVYIGMTKFAKYRDMLFFVAVLLIALTLVIPAYFNAKNVLADTITEEEVEALEWIKDNTANDSTILASIDEGNYITAIAKRKNVADNMFVLAPDRYDAMQEMITTESIVRAVKLMQKNGVDYIYYSESARKKEGNDYFQYIGDSCFRKEFDNGAAKIYKLVC